MPGTLCVCENTQKGVNVKIDVAADLCIEHSAGRPRSWQLSLSREQVLVSFFSKGSSTQLCRWDGKSSHRQL